MKPVLNFKNTKMELHGYNSFSAIYCSLTESNLLSYPEILSSSALIACNAMQCYSLLPLMLALPLTYAVYPLSVHYKCAMKHN